MDVYTHAFLEQFLESRSRGGGALLKMKGDNMVIKVMIKRRVKQGHQAKELVPLLLEMRSRAILQPGYISGESLCDLENPGDCMVISRWESVEDWNKWKGNLERGKIDEKIKSLTGDNTQYYIFSSMTSHEGD